MLMLSLSLSAEASTVWVVIDTNQQMVSVLRDGTPVLKLRGAAFGRGGIGKIHVQGDGRTPLGIFHVAWIDHQSPFHLFFGLDYPTVKQAVLGFKRGIIDKQLLERIKRANTSGSLPPQDTALGGYIGIHGLGKGSLWMHQHFNWTQGCVALTNAQIEKLSQWLAIGTRVVIQ
jgi:murein L,D-transpeptidase YafK